MFLQAITVKIDKVEWLFVTNGSYSEMTMYEEGEKVFGKSVCPLSYVNKVIKQAKQVRKYVPGSNVEFKFI